MRCLVPGGVTIAATASRRRTSKRTGLAAITAAVIVALAGVYFLISQDRPDDCAAEILVNGRALNASAATDLLKLERKASPTAQQVITERLQFYVGRAAELCRDFRRGALTDRQYAERKDEAARWFMRIYRATEAGALTKVAPSDRRELERIVTEAGTNAPAEEMARVTLRSSEGHILPTGADVRDGDQLALDVELPTRRYLYVLGVGTSGHLYRLHPSAASPGQNPVVGRWRIPADPNRFLTVGGPPGRETIHVFISSEPDPRIERVAEVTAAPAAAERAAGQLRNIVELRDLFAPPATSKASRPSRPAPIDVTGRFGRAAATIELDHVG